MNILLEILCAGCAPSQNLDHRALTHYVSLPWMKDLMERIVDADIYSSSLAFKKSYNLNGAILLRGLTLSVVL